MKPVREEQLSKDGQWKVVIRQRDDGNFEVGLFRWTEEIVPDVGKIASFWEPARTAGSITDTIERSREIGLELLRTCARTEI